MNRDQIAEVIGRHLAIHVSRNRMPHMSGDPRMRLPGHVREDFDRACQEAADAIMALDGWQTIDSAPREPMDRFTVLGPPIILGFAPDEEGYTKASREGYWRPALPPGENGRAYSAGWVSTLDPHVEPPYENPTHWRPLPQPPGDAG